MTKKWDLETSNAETELKIGIYAKNWAKQVRLKIFDNGQSQQSTVNGQSQRSESTVNTDVCWRGNMTSPKVDVAEEKQQQARVARECTWAGTCGAREARGRYQRRVAARGGACDAVSSRSWLGFARDWTFCLSMPVVWQLNAQNVDIRVLQVLWAWRRWLASDSDDWMKARAAEERQRCLQEPESQKNSSDTMLTI